MKYPFLLHNAVDDEFVAKVLELCEKRKFRFAANNMGTCRSFLKGIKEVWFLQEKEKLAEKFGFLIWSDALLEDYIGRLDPTGAVHVHSDHHDKHPIRKHVRINVVIREVQGCEPFNDGKTIGHVAAKDAYVTIAGLVKHGTTKVEGNITRIAISYGFMLQDSFVFTKLMPKYLEWLNASD